MFDFDFELISCLTSVAAQKAAVDRITAEMIKDEAKEIELFDLEDEYMDGLKTYVPDSWFVVNPKSRRAALRPVRIRNQFKKGWYDEAKPKRKWRKSGKEARRLTNRLLND